MDFLIQEVKDESQDPAFLIRSQMMLMLLVHGPQQDSQGPRAPWTHPVGCRGRLIFNIIKGHKDTPTN